MKLQGRCDGRTECKGPATSFGLRDSHAQASSGNHFLGNAIISLTSENDHDTYV